MTVYMSRFGGLGNMLLLLCMGGLWLKPKWPAADSCLGPSPADCSFSGAVAPEPCHLHADCQVRAVWALSSYIAVALQGILSIGSAASTCHSALPGQVALGSGSQGTPRQGGAGVLLVPRQAGLSAGVR